MFADRGKGRNRLAGVRSSEGAPWLQQSEPWESKVRAVRLGLGIRGRRSGRALQVWVKISAFRVK